MPNNLYVNPTAFKQAEIEIMNLSAQLNKTDDDMQIDALADEIKYNRDIIKSYSPYAFYDGLNMIDNILYNDILSSHTHSYEAIKQATFIFDTDILLHVTMRVYKDGKFLNELVPIYVCRGYDITVDKDNDILMACLTICSAYECDFVCVVNAVKV